MGIKRSARYHPEADRMAGYMSLVTDLCFLKVLVLALFPHGSIFL